MSVRTEDPASPSPIGGGKTPDLEAERLEAAELLLGDPKMAAVVTGDTVAEIVKSAVEIACKTLREYQAEQAKPPPPNFDGGARGGYRNPHRRRTRSS